MKRAWLFLFLFVLILVNFGVVNATEPVFVDDFETGDLTHTSLGYKWKTPDGGPSQIAGVGGNGFFDRISGTWNVNAHIGQVIYLQNISTSANGDVGLMGPFTVTSNNASRLNFIGDATGVVQTRAHKAFVAATLPYSGTKSVKFIFGPDLAGQDSRSELPFQFGANLSEIWIEYQIYVPSNYYHRTDPPSSNNKFALLLIRDDGGDGIPDDTSRMLYDFETGPNPDGSSQIFVQSISAIASSTSAIKSISNTGYSGDNFVGGSGAVLLGQWNRMRMHVKAASGLGSADAIQELLANDILVFQKTNGDFGYPNISGSNWYGTFPAVVNYGYVLGASNSGFAETTIFYVDDFKIYNADPGWDSQSNDTAVATRSLGSPSGLFPYNTTSTTLSLTTNEVATCRYGTTANTAYSSIANNFSTTGSTSHSSLVSSLTFNTTYNYYVRCNDTSNNVNTNDYTITFRISHGPDFTYNWNDWYTNETINFSLYNATYLQNISNVKFVNQYGRIQFLQNLNLSSDLNLAERIKVLDKKIWINSSLIPQFNKSAMLTFTGVGFSNPIIKIDGVDCPDTKCQNVTFNQTSGQYTFNVTSFSVYEIVEQCADGVRNYDETGKDCGGVCGECKNNSWVWLLIGVLALGIAVYLFGRKGRKRRREEDKYLRRGISVFNLG